MRDLSLHISIDGTGQVKAQLNDVDLALDKTTKRSKDAGDATDLLTSYFKRMVTVGAILGATKAALDYASSLEKMRAATDIGFKGLQQLENIAAGSSTSFQALTAGVLDMQRRLASGDTSAVAAVGKMNLSLDDFKRLKGDQQFLQVARALGNMTSEQERNKLAFDLFGRSYKEILPALVAKVDELKDGVHVMSDETIADVARVQARFERLELTGKRWAVEVAAAMSDAWDSMIDPVTRMQHKMEEAAIHPPNLPDAPNIFSSSALGLDPHDVIRMKYAYQDFDDELRRNQQAAKDSAAESKRLKDELAALKEKAHDVQMQIAYADFNVAALGTRSVLVAPQMSDLSVEISTLAAKFEDLWRIGTPIGTQTLPLIADQARSLGATVGGLATATIGLSQSWRELKGALTDALKGLPDLLTSAFTGGGGLAGAMKALGVSLGVVFAKSLTDSIKANLAAGGSGLTGTGLFAAGGLGAITGVAAVANGASASQAAGQVAMASIAVMTSSAIAAGSLTTAALAAGAATAGIGLAAIGAYYGLKKLFGINAEKKVNPLRQDVVDAAGGLAMLNEKAVLAGVTLDHFLNAKNPKQYKAAVDELNAALSFQDLAAKTLDDTIKKYGFTIEELGPKFRAQQLDQQAQQLYQDYRVLLGAGIDIDLVTQKMAGSVNDYLHLALRTGTEVPIAMKPLLDNMARLGLLTDDAGGIITDLQASGIKFSETMTDGFNRVVASVDRLLAAIERIPGVANSAANAINNLPGYEPGQTGPDFPTSEGAFGGLVTGAGIQRLRGGGVVLPWRPRGSDTVPAMLTPGEGVLSRRGMAALGRLNAGGGSAGSSINVTVHVDGYIDSPAAQRNLAKIVKEQIVQSLKLRERAS